MKASMIILAAAVMLTTGVATASAQSYTVVSGNDYAPFADSKLPEGGIATEVVKLAFAAVDKQVTIEWKPWKRGYQDTLANDNDATFPYVPTDERKAEMLYSDAIYSVKQEVFAPVDKPLHL
ncbi:MAG: amino acid ABC transporter substrate-binding protein, partial [Alphaproteobacteria bacterium]|nr:amino acid ABC transporter substrate-binding protein [Alphaproteobacteria bacterium]